MVKIVVDCKRDQTGLVSLVVYIVVIDGIWTKSSLFHPVRAFQVPMSYAAAGMTGLHSMSYAAAGMTGLHSMSCAVAPSISIDSTEY